MRSLSRRQVLAGVGTGAVGLALGTLPRAVDAGALTGNVEVVDAWPDDTDLIGHLRARVRNGRPPDGDPMTVVCNVWGVGRMTQVPWDVPGDAWPTVGPGETATVHFAAPGESEDVRLYPDRRAMLRVFDRGTEERASDAFVPVEVADS